MAGFSRLPRWMTPQVHEGLAGLAQLRFDQWLTAALQQGNLCCVGFWKTWWCYTHADFTRFYTKKHGHETGKFGDITLPATYVCEKRNSIFFLAEFAFGASCWADWDHKPWRAREFWGSNKSTPTMKDVQGHWDEALGFFQHQDLLFQAWAGQVL